MASHVIKDLMLVRERLETFRQALIGADSDATIDSIVSAQALNLPMLSARTSTAAAALLLASDSVAIHPDVLCGIGLRALEASADIAAAATGGSDNGWCAEVSRIVDMATNECPHEWMMAISETPREMPSDGRGFGVGYHSSIAIMQAIASMRRAVFHYDEALVGMRWLSASGVKGESDVVDEVTSTRRAAAAASIVSTVAHRIFSGDRAMAQSLLQIGDFLKDPEWRSGLTLARTPADEPHEDAWTGGAWRLSATMRYPAWVACSLAYKKASLSEPRWLTALVAARQLTADKRMNVELKQCASMEVVLQFARPAAAMPPAAMPSVSRARTEGTDVSQQQQLSARRPGTNDYARP